MFFVNVGMSSESLEMEEVETYSLEDLVTKLQKHENDIEREIRTVNDRVNRDYEEAAICQEQNNSSDVDSLVQMIRFYQKRLGKLRNLCGKIRLLLSSYISMNVDPDFSEKQTLHMTKYLTSSRCSRNTNLEKLYFCFVKPCMTSDGARDHDDDVKAQKAIRDKIEEMVKERSKKVHT